MSGASAAPDAALARLRVDKWLWAARFYRTRTLASAAVEAGQVRVNGERVKPAHAVTAGASVEVRRQGLAWIVVVTALADRRGSARDAALLYRETDESAAARAAAIAERAANAAARVPGRPTKRDRRKLEDFLNEP
ncbi:MAG TPA: RNA-binding S4 domain-containing protein [Casimicrobiaceae bacterium]|nr:RNA-binding S4 domain-containing protein [Casimicrobiaceae bacterium]